MPNIDQNDITTNLQKLSKPELQKHLRDNNLRVTGNKQSLVERLMSIMHTPTQQPTAHPATGEEQDPESDSDSDNGAAMSGEVREFVRSEIQTLRTDVLAMMRDAFAEMRATINAAADAAATKQTNALHNAISNAHIDASNNTQRVGQHQSPQHIALHITQPVASSNVQPDDQPAQHTTSAPDAQQAQSVEAARNSGASPNAYVSAPSYLLSASPNSPPRAQLSAPLCASASASPHAAASVHQAPRFASSHQPADFTRYQQYAVTHAADNMPEFDPGAMTAKTKSATAFIARLRALQAPYKWDDFLMLEAAQRKLRGQAKEWNDESPVVYATFAQFEADLLATYPSYTTQADVLEEILSQKRGATEGLEDFVRRMINIGRRTYIPDADLASYILKRINHQQFLTSVGCVQVLSVAELLRAVMLFAQKMPEQRYVSQYTASSTSKLTHINHNQAPSFNIQNNHHQQTSSSNNQQPARLDAATSVRNSQSSNTRNNWNNNARPSVTSARPSVESHGPKCWNCKEVGHTSHQCSKPKLTCANCQRIGHAAADCRSTERID